MSTSDPLPSATPSVTPPVRSLAERVSIAAVLILIVGMVLVALVQTVGTDIQRQVHRWSTLQNVSAKPATSSPVRSVDSQTSALPATLSLAADAQISPPRRKPPAVSTTTEPRAEVPVEVVDVPKVDLVEPPLPGLETNPAMLPAPVAPVDATEELLETAAKLVSLSWQDFAYPVKWHIAETAKSRMHYNSHRNRLLRAVAHTSPTALSLEMARKDYAAARSLFDQDPRLDYAFGLVLWKHDQYSEAIEMFQVAARLEGEVFLPAALAVAWGRFLNHDERRGLDQLAHIARLLSIEGDHPSFEQREQAALSIGRALGYLAGPGHSADLEETVRLSSLNILERLPENLRDACEEGRREVGQRQSDLLQFQQVPGEHFQTAHQTRHDELQAKVETVRQEMRDARNELTRDHQSHVDKISDVLKQASKLREQVEKLQPKVKELVEKALEQSRPKPNISVKTMPEQVHVMPGPNGQPRVVRTNARMILNLPETASQRATRIAELTRIHEERKKIAEDLSKLREKQAELVARRREEDRSHKLDREQARAERAARLQEQRELEQRLRDLNKALRRTTELREGLDTIAAYIPWNVEIEGEALWMALNGKSTRSP